MANYMDELLAALHDRYGITDPEVLALIRGELVKSFKNGIMRGRELTRVKKHVEPEK